MCIKCINTRSKQLLMQNMYSRARIVEHLVLHCPAHDQAWRESWPNLHYQSDPRRLWSFLERIGIGRGYGYA